MLKALGSRMVTMKGARMDSGTGRTSVPHSSASIVAAHDISWQLYFEIPD